MLKIKNHVFLACCFFLKYKGFWDFGQVKIVFLFNYSMSRNIVKAKFVIVTVKTRKVYETFRVGVSSTKGI